MKLMVREGCQRSDWLKAWFKLVGHSPYVSVMDIDEWSDLASCVGVIETPALITNDDTVVVGLASIKDEVRRWVSECKNSEVPEEERV